MAAAPVELADAGTEAPNLSPEAIAKGLHLDELPSMLLGLVLVVAGIIFVGWLWFQLRKSSGGADDAGLNYVVGPQGSGKSMFGVREIVSTVKKGQYAVTNVRLFGPGESDECPGGWADAVARKHFPRDARNSERLARRIDWLEGHYVFERSLSEATRYRLPCAVCGMLTKNCSHSGPAQEGRGLFVWDETHNDLNNRHHAGRGADKEAKQADLHRLDVVLTFGTQLRKLGYRGFLLSQHEENTNAQLRRVCNHVVRLQNQRGRGVGRFLPRRLTMFLVFWYPAHLADGARRVPPSRFERYMLPWERQLYDSWEIFHGLDDELGEEKAPIHLPAGGRPRSGLPAASLGAGFGGLTVVPSP